MGVDKELLSVSDVSKITGFKKPTASKLLDDTGKAVILRGRKYIRTADFDKYLDKQTKEEQDEMR